MVDGTAVTVHPTPWTAFYDADGRQYHLLDVNGDTAGTVGDQEVAQTITRLVNESAQRRSDQAPLAAVLPLAERRTVEPPQAPNPAKGTATQWDELFDHLIYLLDAGEYDTLRLRLFDYARVTVGVALPPVFTTPADQSGDHHA